MDFEEYRKAVLEAIGADPDTNVRYFEDFRKAVLDKLGAEYTREDLRNTERWRVKFLEAIQGGGGDEPTGTITITENGLYDVGQYANADVNVEGDQALMALMQGSASGDVEITLPEKLYAMTLSFGDDGGVIPRSNRDVTGLTVRGVRQWGNSEMDVAGNGGLFLASNVTNLKFIRLPDCWFLNIHKYNAYANAVQNLEEFTAPNLQAISAQMRLFGGYNPSKLKQFVCPLLASRLPSGMFYNCPDLTVVDVATSSINEGVFGKDASLAALVLRASAAASLDNVNAFTDTPIESGTGYIYVPRSLISTYEAATNWATFAGGFRAIEDYTDDGTLTGNFVMPAN